LLDTYRCQPYYDKTSVVPKKLKIEGAKMEEPEKPVFSDELDIYER
jgi:hypothetical protein